MTEPRTTFVPVILLGIGAGILSAVASGRTWIEYADPDPRVLDLAIANDGAGQVPLATALSLVVLACWGVVLVTRQLIRRAGAVLGLVAALGVVASVVFGWFTLPDERPEPAAIAEAGDGALAWTPWFWVAAAAAALSVVATALAVRWAPSWPEMGTRYDAPGSGRDEPPPEDRSSLDLWRSMDEGRDPTA